MFIKLLMLCISGLPSFAFSKIGSIEIPIACWPPDRSSVLALTPLMLRLTPDPLLSLERFSLGGADTVRGYRQNQVVSDNGLLGGFELQIPVTKNPNLLQLNPSEFWCYRGIIKMQM